MDGGIALLILLALVVVGGSIAGIFAFFQLSSLKREVAALRVKLNATYTQHPQTNTANQFDNSNDDLTDTAKFEPEPVIISKPIEAIPKKPEQTKPKPATLNPLVSQLVTQIKANWLTWVGAVALAFGGIFLARYSLEAGLLSETMRLTLGAIFGLSLIVAAEVLHRKGIIFDGFSNYIPAALASGGFISCFALTLLAYSHYGLLQALPAFSILTLVSVAASWMALRFGPVLAVIGIIGAYSVPVWVNTGSN